VAEDHAVWSYIYIYVTRWSNICSGLPCGGTKTCSAATRFEQRPSYRLACLSQPSRAVPTLWVSAGWGLRVHKNRLKQIYPHADFRFAVGSADNVAAAGEMFVNLVTWINFL
jgi:hypothetical protein